MSLTIMLPMKMASLYGLALRDIGSRRGRRSSFN